MKLIKIYLICLLLLYAFAFGYMLTVGLLEDVSVVREGLFLWSVGGVFGLLGYRIANRRKVNKHYFD